jgi:hypothetical protein
VAGAAPPALGRRIHTLSAGPPSRTDRS